MGRFTMKKIIFIVIAFFCVILSACSFEPRTSATFPAELNPVYFSSDSPYAALSVELNRSLRSLNIQLAKQPTHARFSIVVSNSHFIFSRPDIVDTNLPTTLNFLQTATIAIEDNHNHTTVVSKSFSASQLITLDANQNYTADKNNLMRQALSRRLVSLIYYWLISSNTKAELHNAIIGKPTRHAT